jgi:hypothetical protein
MLERGGCVKQKDMLLHFISGVGALVKCTSYVCALRHGEKTAELNGVLPLASVEDPNRLKNALAIALRAFK